MTVQEQASLVPFDVLSYPRSAEISSVIVDVTRETTRSVHSQALYLGRDAVRGADAEVASQYARIAEDIGYRADRTMLLTDRRGVAEASLRSGMGVIRVDEGAHVETPLELILNPSSQTDRDIYGDNKLTDMTLEQVAAALYRPGKITTVGFVGPTGAGKSTTIRRLLDLMPKVDGRAGLFEVDAFFKLSRADRKAWLNEPDISDAERAERQRVVTWWDLGKATDTLVRIRDGEHVQMEGLYDMRQGGEMVGTLDINPGNEGYTVFVEGTALLVPEFRDVLDEVVYLNTHDQVRTDNLRERNRRDGYTDDESRTRKQLTDAAEMGEHLSEDLRKTRFTDRGLIVLDNSNRTANTLRLMPPYIPRR